MDEFLGDDVRFIERECLYGIKSRGIGDGCNVKSKCDGSG